MSAIAIITARGGSKRIPRKNIKEFCGKPIIAYSIEAALTSGLFDEVMVSTDDEEIAGVARSCGAEVPFLRSAENSDDYASTADVLKEVLEEYEKLGKKYDIMACIYPTAPFVTAGKLCEAMDKLKSDDVDSVIPVVTFSFPPQRAFVVRNGYIEYNQPEFASSRSQDLESLYHDCGQFYLCKTEAFLRNNSLVTSRTAPIVVSEMEVQDIDNISDWEIAEAKYKVYMK